MKTLSALLAILLLPAITFAQKMLEPQIDGFTHEVTISTEAYSIASEGENYIVSYFTRTNKVYYLNLRIDLLHENHDAYTISAGSNVLFKLANDSLITLPIVKNMAAEAKDIRDGYYTFTYWSVTIVLPLTREDIYRIAQTDKTGIRIEANESNIDFGIQPKQSLYLKKQAALILAQP